MDTSGDVSGAAEGPRAFLLYHARDMDMMRSSHAAIHLAQAWLEAACANFAVGAPYRLVAIILADSVEDVFRRSNHGVDPGPDGSGTWYTGPQILRVYWGSLRSTSVGDVVVDPERGLVLACAGVGWSEILPNGVLGRKVVQL